jgi:hypothetical protein
MAAKLVRCNFCLETTDDSCLNLTSIEDTHNRRSAALINKACVRVSLIGGDACVKQRAHNQLNAIIMLHTLIAMGYINIII